MHWKIKRKLSGATKLYLVEPENDKATELKVQLYGEYVSFQLNLPFPRKVDYRSLEYGGFNYDPIIDTPITHYSKKSVIRNLENSKGYRSNDSDTIDSLIDLIKHMSDYI